tara:strand:+ start:216 stop:383 length:168 start_codon:yes stop_codon:yes gene_type:complete
LPPTIAIVYGAGEKGALCSLAQREKKQQEIFFFRSALEAVAGSWELGAMGVVAKY